MSDQKSEPSFFSSWTFYGLIGGCIIAIIGLAWWFFYKKPVTHADKSDVDDRVEQLTQRQKALEQYVLQMTGTPQVSHSETKKSSPPKKRDDNETILSEETAAEFFDEDE